MISLMFLLAFLSVILLGRPSIILVLSIRSDIAFNLPFLHEPIDHLGYEIEPKDVENLQCCQQSAENLISIPISAVIESSGCIENKAKYAISREVIQSCDEEGNSEDGKGTIAVGAQPFASLG